MIHTNIGVIPWRNETGSSNYPLGSDPFDVRDVIVDAAFVQFDNFVPSLKSIRFTTNSNEFVISTSTGDTKVVTPEVIPEGVVAITEPKFGNVIGKLVVGDGFYTLRSKYPNMTLPIDVKFLATTVVSVNSSMGVFSVLGATGDVTFRATAKNHVHFERTGLSYITTLEDQQLVTLDGNILSLVRQLQVDEEGYYISGNFPGVLFDAVAKPECNDKQPVMSINDISMGNLFVEFDELISVSAQSGGMKLALSAGSLIDTKIVPTS